ncbi:MAG: hypothetical protein AAGC58_06585 [Asticcacaulis sp.]
MSNVVHDDSVWRVIIAAPKKQAYVRSQLKPVYFDVYTPQIIVPRKVNGRGDIAYLPRPAFGDYLFVRARCPFAPSFKDIFGINLVLNNAVSEREISEVRASEAAGLIHRESQKNLPLSGPKKGDAVTAFDGIVSGVISKVVSKKVVEVSCPFMGRHVIFQINPDRLRAA